MIFRFTFIILSLVSVGFNVLFCSLLFMSNIEFKQRLVFDLDKVRADYVRDIRFTYQTACKTGTEYPEEYKKPTVEWNTNSPINWCNGQLEDYQSTIDTWLVYLGRTK
jgi:hypothetical protein